MIQVIKDIIWGWQVKRAIRKANKLSKLLGMKYYVVYMNGSLKVVPKRSLIYSATAFLTPWSPCAEV